MVAVRHAAAIDIVSLPIIGLVRTLVDNAALAARVAPWLNPPVEFIKTVIGDGVTA